MRPWIDEMPPIAGAASIWASGASRLIDAEWTTAFSVNITPSPVARGRWTAATACPCDLTAPSAARHSASSSTSVPGVADRATLTPSSIANGPRRVTVGSASLAAERSAGAAGQESGGGTFPNLPGICNAIRWIPPATRTSIR